MRMGYSLESLGAILYFLLLFLGSLLLGLRTGSVWPSVALLVAGLALFVLLFMSEELRKLRKFYGRLRYVVRYHGVLHAVLFIAVRVSGLAAWALLLLIGGDRLLVLPWAWAALGLLVLCTVAGLVLVEIHDAALSRWEGTAARRACSASKGEGAGRGTLTAPTHDFEGEVLQGRYLVRDARRGGMGVVRLCYDIVGRQPIAMKVVETGAPWSDAQVEQLRREALLWIKLGKHPHIVQARYVWQVHYEVAIFMDMVPSDEAGRVSLADWILLGNLSLTDIVKLAVHICRGMSYAHEKLGLVHRDLKPSNVLVAPGTVAKVTDFGLAKALADSNVVYQSSPTRTLEGTKLPTLTVTGGVFGTPQYMAPEQWDDAKNVDTRADIYSFGCMLYEMLTRRHVNGLPFGRDTFTMGDWYRFHQGGQVSDVRGFPVLVPGELRDLIMRCMARAPEQRFTSFEELGEVLGRLYQQVTGHKLPVLRSEKSSAADLVSRASSLEQLGLHGEAAKCCDEALAADPENAIAWYTRGVALAWQGRYKESLICFDRCLEIDQEHAKAWTSKGGVLLALGEVGEARGCFLQAQELSPANLVRSSRVVVALRPTSFFGSYVRDWLQDLGIPHENISFAAESEEAIHLAAGVDPDLLVTEMGLDGTGVPKVISRIKRQNPHTFVLVMCDATTGDAFGRLTAAGADACLRSLDLAWASWRRPELAALLARARRPIPSLPFATARGGPLFRSALGQLKVIFLFQDSKEVPLVLQCLDCLGVNERNVVCLINGVAEPSGFEQRGLKALDLVVFDALSLHLKALYPRGFTTNVPKWVAYVRAVSQGKSRVIAFGDGAWRDRAEVLGVDAYIVKPVTREKFIDTVLSLFSPTLPSKGPQQAGESEANES